MRTEEHVFFGRHENMRTCFLGGDKRTEEHGFLEDMRTREHEKKGKGLLEQNENKRFGWALPNTRFLRYPHLTIGFFTLHFSLNIWIFHSSLFTLHLTSPLLVVPTDRRPHRSSFYFTMLLGATVMTTYHYGCRNPISLIMSFTTLNFTLEASLLS